MPGAIEPGTGPALYAFTLGLVAALNPCGFPLLPAYLTLFGAQEEPQGWVRQSASGLRIGASVTLGFLVVFGIFGIVAESGVHVLMGWIPWVMIPIGLALVALGVAAALGRSVALSLPTVPVRGRRGVVAMAGFGATYAVASLSCALPLFLAGVAGSFTRAGVAQGMVTVVAYALGMGLFLIVASLAVAHAGSSALRRIRPLSRFVPRVGGVVLALVGGYLVYYWISDLTDPLATPGLVRAVEGVQGALSNWLAGAPRLFGVLAGVVVVGAIWLVVLSRRRSPSSDAAVSPSGRPASGETPHAGVCAGGTLTGPGEQAGGQVTAIVSSARGLAVAEAGDARRAQGDSHHDH